MTWTNSLRNPTDSRSDLKHAPEGLSRGAPSSPYPSSSLAIIFHGRNEGEDAVAPDALPLIGVNPFVCYRNYFCSAFIPLYITITLIFWAVSYI